MAMFHYTAVTDEQEIRTGSFPADDEGSVIDHLALRGLTPLKIERGSTASKFRELLGKEISFVRGISGKQLASLFRQAQLLLEAGLEVERVLSVMASTSADSREKVLLNAVLGDVRSGSSLADALGDHPRSFPPGLTALVRAGEASGTLPRVLQRIAEMAERTQQVRSEIQAALIYPAFLCVAAVVSLVLLLVVVVPNFLPIFEESGAQLPGATQFVVDVSDFVRENMYALGLGMVALFVAAKIQLRRPRARLYFDRGLLASPILGGLISALETARLSHTLASLLGGGVSMGRSLALAREGIANSAIRDAVSKTIDNVNSGEPLARSLEKDGLFPSLAIRLWRIGEETGRLPEMLDRVGRILDEQSSQTVKKLLALLVPLLTIAMGAMTAFIVYSILVAVLSINEVAV